MLGLTRTPGRVDDGTRCGTISDISGVRRSMSKAQQLRIVRFVGVMSLNYAARERALASHPGVEVHVVEVSTRRGHSEWQGEYDTTGFTLHNLFGSMPMADLSSSDVARRGIEKVASLQPDVVVVGNYSERFSRAISRYAVGSGAISILASDVHSLSGGRRRPVREWLKRQVIRGLYHGVLVAGERSRTYNQQLAFDDIPIVQGLNTVDHAYFEGRCKLLSPIRMELRRAAGLEAKAFLYVGRLSPEKNLATLLKGYARYRSQSSGPWDLVLVGAGPQEAELRRLATALNLEGLHWKGWQAYDSVAQWYVACDALVLPSTAEPWGWVVNEAMVCGLPVVVSERCGCAPELVSECDNGYWFDPHRECDIALALGKMSAATNLERMSARSREIVSRFRPEVYGRRLLYCIERAREWRDGPGGTRGLAPVL